MPRFGNRSESIIETIDPRLEEVIRTVIQLYDFSVRSGYRGEEEQMKLYYAGKSQKTWPESKHNREPSHAVDILPYPFYLRDWEDTSKFYYLAGAMMQTAYLLGTPLRWGGDWNQNHVFTDERFRDMMHFELVVL